MRIIVTGGAGFIGSNVVDRYVEDGNEVAVLDNLSTGKLENINPRAKFYEMSILDDALEKVFAEFRPQVVNHHAAQMDVRKSTADPVFDAKENILGSLKVIMNSVNCEVEKFVYASTGGAVYGEVEKIPVDESHPVNPISPYGVSKHTVEHYLYLYGQNYGLKYTVLRYPNVFGPRQDPFGEAGVIAIFTEALLNGVRPTIFGDGEQTRDYTFVEDIVESNVLALDRGDFDIFNIGTGVETSVNEVFWELIRNFGSTIEPVYAPKRLGEIERIALNATKAKANLGWSPKFAFAEGVAKTVSYYKSLKKKGG